MFQENFSKLALVCLCVSVSLFSSCKKDKKEDDTVKETTAEEDKSTVNTSLNSVSNSVSGIKDSKGVSAFINFYDIESGDVNNEEWADDVFYNLEDLLDFTSLDEDNPKFDFNLNKGEYSYVPETGEWKKVSSDKMIFNFPSDEQSKSNNARFVLSKYSDTEVNSFDESFNFPTTIDGTLSVDGVEVFSMDFDAVWNSELPTSMSYIVKSAPYSMELSGRNNGDKIFSFNYAIKNNGVTEIGAAASVTMKNSNYDNWTEDDIVMVSLNVTLSELTLKTTIDIQKLNNIPEDASNEMFVDQINLYTDGQIFQNDTKLADLEFRLDGEIMNLYLVYKDGSAELADDVLTDVLKEIEKAIEPIVGDELVLE